MKEKIVSYCYMGFAAVLCVWFVFLFVKQMNKHHVCIDNGFTNSEITMQGELNCFNKVNVPARSLPGYKN